MKKQMTGLALCLCAMLIVMTGCSQSENYVTLGEYKGISLTKASTTPTDEEVENSLNSILGTFATPVQVTDRAVAEGDTVNIDYRGLLDGVAFEGGTAEGYNLTIGSGRFIPGFEDGLVDAMPGTDVNLDVTFPEDYDSAELAGKAVVFEVKVHYIHGEGDPIVPEFTDEWVAANSDFATTAEYREDVRAQLVAEMEAAAPDTDWNTMVEAVVGNATFESLPEERIAEEMQAQKDYYVNYASMFGMDLDGLIAAFGMTAEEFDAELHTMAEDYVKRDLVFKKVAEVEKITLTTEEKDTYSQEYGYDSYAHFAESYDPAVINDVLLSDKVGDFLMENNLFV